MIGVFVGLNPGNWLNYHHLFYFRTIAREGSLARASLVLRIGTSALSLQLKALEEQLGVKLFTRSNRKLVLTPEGLEVLRHANQIFEMGLELQSSLPALSTGKRQHIRIGALDSIPKHLIFQLVEKFLQEPATMVSVYEGNEDNMLRELLSSNIDIFITNHLPQVPKEFSVHSRRLSELEIAICGSKQFLKLKIDFPKSLNGQKFVVPTQHSRLRADIEHFFKINHITVNIVAETQDTSLQKIMGQNGIGLIPISHKAVKPLIKHGDLELIGILPGVFESLYLVKPKNLHEKPIVSRIFTEFEWDQN